MAFTEVQDQIQLGRTPQSSHMRFMILISDSTIFNFHECQVKARSTRATGCWPVKLSRLLYFVKLKYQAESVVFQVRRRGRTQKIIDTIISILNLLLLYTKKNG